MKTTKQLNKDAIQIVENDVNNAELKQALLVNTTCNMFKLIPADSKKLKDVDWTEVTKPIVTLRDNMRPALFNEFSEWLKTYCIVSIRKDGDIVANKSALTFYSDNKISTPTELEEFLLIADNYADLKDKAQEERKQKSATKEIVSEKEIQKLITRLSNAKDNGRLYQSSDKVLEKIGTLKALIGVWDESPLVRDSEELEKES